MVDFDGRKRVKDISFDHVPIWLHALGMPLVMMNKETGMVIGNEVGSFVEMELYENGSAVGQFLRTKVKLNINKPLMHGIFLMEEEDDNPVWCPIVYKFLVEFCYTCGIIGHIDKACAMIMEKGRHNNTQRN